MNNRWKPSATVAAIIERDGRFLLVEEHTQDGLRLNNPAGHLDPGESPIEACVRETLEETAFHFTPGALVGIYMSRFEKAVPGQATPLDITYMRFASCGTLGEEVAGQALDEGIVRTLWLSPEEIRACVPRVARSHSPGRFSIRARQAATSARTVRSSTTAISPSGTASAGTISGAD